MKYITVFCGSSEGNDPEILQSAKLLGSELAAQGYGLVYGGAKVGLMGAVADSVIASGGRAIGVLPRFFNKKEVAHDALTELVYVDSMQERKNIMNEKAEGFIILPGAYGTLDELFEVLTLTQLHLLSKPIGVLNVGGFYDSLLEFLSVCAAKGFLHPDHLSLLLSAATPSDLIDKMRRWSPPSTSKWFLERVGNA